MEATAAFRRRTRVSGRARDAIALALWVALIAAAFAWGTALREDGARIALGAAPLFGSWDLEAGAGVLAPIATAGAIAVAGPIVAARASWGWLLAATVGGAAIWSVALALAHGVAGITSPLEGPSDYLASIPVIGSADDFVSGFTERIDEYSTHVRSHPPGMALILLGLDRAGLGGPGPAAALILAIAASSGAAALISLRAVASTAAARRAAPFVAMAPAAVWIATTADALYMGVGAWAVTALVVSIRATGRRSIALALIGGLLFGALAFLSFGLVLLAAIPVTVAIAARRWPPLLIGGAAALLVVLAFLAAGYWWLDGFTAAREQYANSIARTRPYDFFAVNNLAVFAIALGPALAIALARLRDRATWLLVGGALAAVAFADLTGMSKGEVERIWLPFIPWVLLAATALSPRIAAQRALLATQAACAIAIEVGVATIW